MIYLTVKKCYYCYYVNELKLLKFICVLNQHSNAKSALLNHETEMLIIVIFSNNSTNNAYGVIILLCGDYPFCFIKCINYAIEAHHQLRIFAHIWDFLSMSLYLILV